MADDCSQGPAIVAPETDETDEEQLVAEVRGLLTFEDCPTVLRASGLPSLLSQFGRVFSSARGSARTYQLSTPVEKIDFFLSHNWVIARWKKYLCLVVYFNFVPAMVVTAGILAVLAVLSARGYFPPASPYEQFEGWKDPAWREGFVCQVVVLPIFLFILFFWQDILRHTGYKGLTAFLDKTCIHQEDPSVMRMGIERLGAFIMRSDQMVILYTELYLTKLWTIYEVAASLTLNGGGSIRVLHIHNAVLLICMLAVTWLTAMGYIIIHEVGGSFLMLYVVIAVLAGFCFRDLRRWQIRKLEVERRISSFNVRDCTCAVEDDRPVVYLNISRLMRVSNIVRQNATQEEALDAFNARVRDDLMRAFHASSGPHAFHYHHYVMLGFLISGGKGLDMLVSLDRGLDPRYIICFNLNVIAWVFGVWPICFVLLGKAAAAKTHLTGCKKVLYIIFGFSSPFVLGILTTIMFQTIRYRAETSHLWLFLAILMVPVAISAALVLVFGEDWAKKRRMRNSVEERARAQSTLKSIFSATNSSALTDYRSEDRATQGVASAACNIDLDINSLTESQGCSKSLFQFQDDLDCGENFVRRHV